MSSIPAISEASNERRSRRFWVALILGFFGLDLAIAIIAIVMAASDPSFRPMPDYGDRSVTWEVHHQEQRRSAELGWSVAIVPIEPDRQAIDFIVSDRSGNPVTNAAGAASAYHLTRVAQQQHASLEEAEAGRYRARIDCRQPGLWKFELRLSRQPDASTEAASGDEVYVYEALQDFPAGEL